MKDEQDPREPGQDSQREWILEQVALGQLAPDAPEVATLAHRDAAFARELEELVRTRASAERALREGRELFERAPASVTEADRRRVHETLHRLAAESAPAPRRRWTPILVGAGLVAAAAVVVAVMRPWDADEPARPDDDFLGPTETHGTGSDLEITVTGDGRVEIDWTDVAGPGEALELDFYELVDGDHGDFLRRVPVRGHEWTSSNSSSLPDEFYVELVLTSPSKPDVILQSRAFER